MDSERRKISRQKPAEMERDLNDAQLITLRNLENFGWELRFVRNPLFQEPVAVLVDTDTGECSVLEEDGDLNKNHDLTIRD